MLSAEKIAGVRIPTSKLALAANDLAKRHLTRALYHHAKRVFLFASVMAVQRSTPVNRDLLFVASMFHNFGLIEEFCSQDDWFEVDGANASRQFLAPYGIPEQDIHDVWDAIALHTTFDIARHKRPIVALIATGVAMDVLGLGYDTFPAELRNEICLHHPRGNSFKHDILASIYVGTRNKRGEMAASVRSDIHSRFDSSFKRWSYCDQVLRSAWSS